MATLGPVTELRTLTTLAQLEDVAVEADVEIVPLTGSIENNGVTFVSIQVFFENNGRLYVETPSGKRHYLTDPLKDYTGTYQILTTYMLPRNETVSLKYSTTTTMTGLCIVSGGGVF